MKIVIRNKEKGNVLLESIIGITLLMGMAVVTITVIKQAGDSRRQRIDMRENIMIMEALIKEVSFNYSKEELEEMKILELDRNTLTLKDLSNKKLEEMQKGEKIKIKIEKASEDKIIVNVKMELGKGKSLEERIEKEE